MIDLKKIEDRRLAENVLLGSDGYIFLRNDRNNTMAQITGKKTLSGRGLRAWGNLLELRRAWFSSKNIKYYYIAAPCKESIYKDHLPEDIKVSNNRPIMQIMEYLEKQKFPPIIYPEAALIAERSRMPTYPKGDSHWNWFGAFVAYEHLMDAMDPALPRLTLGDINFSEKIMNSDLASKIGLNDIVIHGQVKNPKAKLTKRNNVSNIGNYKVYENSDKSLPCCVMFRDSFSNYTCEYLAESFRRLVVVWQPNIDYSLVRDENPDIVISQQAERFMVVVPDDLNASTNRGYVAGKVKDGSVSEEQAKISDA